MQGTRMSRRRALQGLGGGAAALSASVFFGACGGDDEGDSPGSSGGGTPASADTRATAVPSATAKTGGTLRVALSADPTGLDPSTSRGGNDHHWLYSIFDNLVNNDPTFQVSKGIAEKWEVVDDLTVAFTVAGGRDHLPRRHRLHGPGHQGDHRPPP